MSSYIPQIPEVAVNKFLNDMQYNFDQLSTEYTAIKKRIRCIPCLPLMLV